jgi:hypothetical protein
MDLDDLVLRIGFIIKIVFVCLIVAALIVVTCLAITGHPPFGYHLVITVKGDKYAEHIVKLHSGMKMVIEGNNLFVYPSNHETTTFIGADDGITIQVR